MLLQWKWAAIVCADVSWNSISCSVAASLVRVESLQLLQEDVAVGHGVVRVGHDEELEDGPSAGAQEQDRPVPGRSGLGVHHNLVQLVPERKTETKHCISCAKLLLEVYFFFFKPILNRWVRPIRLALVNINHFKIKKIQGRETTRENFAQ